MHQSWRTIRRAATLVVALVILGFAFPPSHSLAMPQNAGGASTFIRGVTAPPTTVNLRDVHNGTGTLQYKALPFLGYHGPSVPMPAGTGAPNFNGKPPLAGLGPGWEAIDYNNSFCGCLPPDGGIAVGPSDVIALVNTSFKIFNKSGSPLSSATSFASLFGTTCAPNTSYSDPSGEYDQVSGQFIMEILVYSGSGQSSLCIAVSKTGDPTGSWYLFNVPIPGTNNLYDFPHFSIGSDALYFSGNLFPNFGAFTQAEPIAVNKAQLESGTAANFVAYTGLASTFDTLHPAHTAGISAEPYVEPGYYVSVDDFQDCPPTCSHAYLFKWTDPFGANTFNEQGSVTLTSYAQPIPAKAKGSSSVNVDDARDQTAYYYNGTVYSAHAIECNPGSGNVDCVQWFQLGNIDSTPTLIQQGIISGNAQYRYYPSLAIDKKGDMIIGYSYSSSSDYIGIKLAARLAGDAPGTTRGEGFLHAGQGADSESASRWGDYAMSAIDATGCGWWHLEEFAPSNGNTDIWDTWIGSLTVPNCS